jgi:hypothetical protein
MRMPFNRTGSAVPKGGKRSGALSQLFSLMPDDFDLCAQRHVFRDSLLLRELLQ